MLASLREVYAQHPHKVFWIALSGGVDSQVLLFLLHQLRAAVPVDVRAIHVNHGLSPHAAQWATHCRQSCEALQIAYHEHHLQLDLQTGDSLEDLARKQRYAIFSRYIDSQSLLLTAHHQDDQAETVLLQLCRGAGPKGLSAMPRIKTFAQGFQVRPLLGFSRAALLSFAQEHQLRWVEDESNNNTIFTRNFIRHDVLPVLQSRWPAIAAVMSRSAAHCAENQLLLDEFAQEIFQQSQGSRPHTLSVQKLLALSSPKQKMLLRYWIHSEKFPLPDSKKLQSIQQTVLTAAPDRLPCVRWARVILRRFRDDLFLLSERPKPAPTTSLTWDMQRSLSLPHGDLQVQTRQGQGLAPGVAEVSIGFRQGGEVIDMPGRGRHTLKKLLQEWQVLPWERDELPLVSVAGEVIAVLGYYLNQRFAAQQNEWGRCLTFTPNAMTNPLTDI